jgi:hypothetical protein
MGRQILALIIGVVLSFLAAAMCAAFLYRHSTFLSLPGPASARYILNPLIALFVGACVGLLTKSRSGAIAALALAPWALGFLLFRRQDTAHLLVLLVLVILYLSIGMAGAMGAFRMRGAQGAPNRLGRI